MGQSIDRQGRLGDLMKVRDDPPFAEGRCAVALQCEATPITSPGYFFLVGAVEVVGCRIVTGARL